LVKAPGEGGILTTVVDLKDIDYGKGMIETVGHYSRPDWLSLLVNSTATKTVTEMKKYLQIIRAAC
jgi:nitrilase